MEKKSARAQLARTRVVQACYFLRPTGALPEQLARTRVVQGPRIIASWR